MSRIRGLELLYNLEKNKLKSREDCVVAAVHCLFINENLQCVGIGDAWPDSNSCTTELLPKDWNSNQDVYSLRYTSKDNKTRLLLKITKMEHILQVDVVMNEDVVSNMSVPVANYISDDYSDYSTAYKDLGSLSESFRKDVMEKFQPRPKKEIPSSETKKNIPAESPRNPSAPIRSPASLQQERDPYRFGFPRVGGNDLDPFGSGGGGMLMDPSSFGIPSRPTLPQFGVGGPRGLPRGAVPPGARFDPFMPPIMPHRFNPDPDHFRPPDYDDFM